VYISMHTFGEMPAWISALATAALACLLALFPALATAAARQAAGANPWGSLLAWPAAWTLGEWLRATVLTGLPWIASGYAHTDGPLAGYAPLAGIYGVSLAAASAAGAFALATSGRGRLAAVQRAGALAAAALMLAGGQWCRHRQWTHETGTPVQVALIQGNVPQDLKFADGGLELSVQRYFSLLSGPETEQADLVVLPESAFPVPLGDLPPQVRDGLRDFSRQRHRALIFGAFVEEPAGHYYNSAIGLQDESPAQQYRKRHLVPFGEFIPFGFRWFVDLMKIPIGDQEHGTAQQAPMQLAGQRIAVSICFEDLFGAEIRQAWSDPANEPTLLLNLSNLAWFADSIALPQHLQISRMRALETGRPLLSATNTGVTAVIDAHGQVLAQLPLLSARTLAAPVRGFAGRTPYVRWGDAPALVLAAAMLAAARIGSRRRTASDRIT
jgi:apolipoprotein N-acyltransferase